MENYDDRLVEVIEDGRIAKVPEFYAKREGLPILRRIATPKIDEQPKDSFGSFGVGKKKEFEFRDKHLIVDNFRKPHWKDKQVLSDLVENFHWMIRVQRRRKGFTRAQLAKQINEREEYLRMIENGVLPTKDFILINKIQEALGISLRKDKTDYTKTAHQMIRDGQDVQKSKERELARRAKEKELSGIYGKDVDILEDS